ncbi:D-hexose-6-phosphate mutarotase [Hydrogenovibrio marinus]|uniref:Putative glucose-6-phosphate 1-epimerase n=1 Tax=Hydrogenovibrio marinus TaxID=28885 RepID=A0A067A1I2_HYDMR|nr:D-hexose-6-phosphate mutarotase [Hydrogenovibrio marinus]KDN96170.1 aldose epimerase [Hydrogenovibrio marinus]BBN60653.1 D-hexose-6-phosphate mutarotase [Hydrogenovibrio marinus]
MIDALAQQFDAEGVSFSMQDHLMMIEIDNPFATAKITTHGASLLSYVPKQGASAGKDLIWVSESAVYDGKKPVRGGVPICWPWFGKSDEEGLPAHGFVRNRVWHLEKVHTYESGVTEILLVCDSDADSHALWPHAFHLSLRIEIGEKLSMALTTHNLNCYDLSITEALHTYFTVANPQGIKIEGLEGSTLLDKLTYADAVQQQGVVVVEPPMDNVYLNQSGKVSFEDVGLNRRIVIEKDSSLSSVVWNPGPEGVKAFGDMSDDAWQTMLCVESGNVLDNAVLIPSESKHTLTMILSAESL